MLIFTCLIFRLKHLKTCMFVLQFTPKILEHYTFLLMSHLFPKYSCMFYSHMYYGSSELYDIIRIRCYTYVMLISGTYVHWYSAFSNCSFIIIIFFWFVKNHNWKRLLSYQTWNWKKFGSYQFFIIKKFVSYYILHRSLIYNY